MKLRSLQRTLALTVVASSLFLVGSRLGNSQVNEVPRPNPDTTDDPSRASEAGVGREWVNSIGMEFVWVPAGEFVMGSESEHADDDEQPLTRVRISEGYWLGKFEVTQGEWEAVMGSNPSRFPNCGSDCPVENVSWNEVQVYIERLNGREGTGDVPVADRGRMGIRCASGDAGGHVFGGLDGTAW